MSSIMTKKHAWLVHPWTKCSVSKGILFCFISSCHRMNFMSCRVNIVCDYSLCLQNVYSSCTCSLPWHSLGRNAPLSLPLFVVNWRFSTTSLSRVSSSREPSLNRWCLLILGKSGEEKLVFCSITPGVAHSDKTDASEQKHSSEKRKR